MCNGQPRDPSKFHFSLRACNADTCSGWTATLTVTVSGVVSRPAGSGTTTYIHTDGLRSPVAETTAAGTVTSRRYEPYGASTSGVPQQGPGYTGHVTDAETGLSYMQQRYYDPMAGRFLSTDPVAANAGGFNRYWYANNNPYKYIDPDGREVFDCRGSASCPSQIKIADLKNGDVVKTDGAMIRVDNKTGDLRVTFKNPSSNGSSAAKTGPRIVPEGPPGANRNANIDNAKWMDPFNFRDTVQNKGPWDYKQLGSKYEPFGNFNYGSTARSVGFSEGILLQEAGRYQGVTRTSNPAWGVRVRDCFLVLVPAHLVTTQLINSGYNKELDIMTRMGARFYLVIIICSIVFSGCGRDGLFSDCDRVIKPAVLSPDSKFKIAMLSVQCGATTADATWLLLTSSDQAFDYERDVFAVFQGDDVRAAGRMDLL